MADFTALKTAIQNAIKQNGNEEITGAILQEVMLAVVSTLGDSAINDLVTALSNEVTARQNADGTLQTNINNEATARGNADTALGTRIDGEATARENADNALGTRIDNEATARGNADTALQNAINAINTKLAEGYVYVGAATTSTNPSTPSGKVFYIAVAAGTYTNFLNSSSQPLVLTQGINILKFNGTSWSTEQVIAIDDEPTAGSNSLVKSGGVFPLVEIMEDNANFIDVETGGISSSDGSNTVDNTSIRTGFIPISSSNDSVVIVSNVDEKATNGGGNRYYDSSYAFLGTSYTSEAAYLRRVLSKTDWFDVGKVSIMVNGVTYETTKYKKVETENSADEIKKSVLSLFSNILDNNLSNFDLTKRIATNGQLISNSGYPDSVINKGLLLEKGTYYISGSFGDSTPRVSKNGYYLLNVTSVSTNVYSFTLDRKSYIYIGWKLNSQLTALNTFALVSCDVDFDTTKFGIFSRHYLGLDEPKDFPALVEEKSKNLINLAAVNYSKYYSNGSHKMITSTAYKEAVTEFIAVEEGVTYCISGSGIQGLHQGTIGNAAGGYYTGTDSDTALSNITFVADIDHFTFTVPTGQNIKYVVIGLHTNDARTELSGNAQMEIGEIPTQYQPYELIPKIKESLLPDSAIPVSNALNEFITFANIHYPEVGDKISKFRRHWLYKDKDVVVVNTGTSLTARDYCAPLSDAPFRPPLMHVENLPSLVWDKLKWDNQQYRRYDSEYFTEVGDFVTKSNDENWDDYRFRNGLTRIAENGSNSVSFKVPVEAWQFNFIYRTDILGCENCSVVITEGDGYMEVWNGTAWVEANGFTFSMRQGNANKFDSVTFVNPKTGTDKTISNVYTGGNTIYQKRLKMRCTTHKTVRVDSNGNTVVDVAGTEKNVTISGTGRFMYWGVEWSPRQYMITYINAARGSCGSAIDNGQYALIHYQDTDIWEFEPDLLLTEDPICNAGGETPVSWFSGTTPNTPVTYWGQVTENFFFAENQVSMTARAKTVLGVDNVPEFAIFSPYVIARSARYNTNNELQVFPLNDGNAFTVADAIMTIYDKMKETHSGVIYLNCVKQWMEVCNKVYGNIVAATTGSGISGSTLTFDGVHPNTNGSKVWARLVLPLLDFII